MIAVIALILAIIAILGLALHVVLADAPAGMAHRENWVNDWLVRNGWFSPGAGSPAIAANLPPSADLLPPIGPSFTVLS